MSTLLYIILTITVNSIQAFWLTQCRSVVVSPTYSVSMSFHPPYQTPPHSPPSLTYLFLPPQPSVTLTPDTVLTGLKPSSGLFSQPGVLARVGTRRWLAKARGPAGGGGAVRGSIPAVGQPTILALTSLTSDLAELTEHQPGK